MNCAKFVAQLHVLADEEGSITSLASCGDVVFVGTSLGYVHRYAICRGVSDDREIYSTLTHRTSLLRQSNDGGDPSIRRVAKLQHVTPASTADLVSSLQRKMNSTVAAWVNVLQQQPAAGGTSVGVDNASSASPYSQRFGSSQGAFHQGMEKMSTQPPSLAYMQEIEGEALEEYLSDSVQKAAHTVAFSDVECAAIAATLRESFTDEDSMISPEAVKKAIIKATFDRENGNLSTVQDKLKEVPWESGNVTGDQGKDRTDVAVKRHLSRLLGVPMYKLDASPSLLCALCHKRVYLIDSSSMEIVYQVCPASNAAGVGSPMGAGLAATVTDGGGAMDSQPGLNSQMLIGNGIATFSLSLSTILMPTHAADRILFLKHAQRLLDKERAIEASLRVDQRNIFSEINRVEGDLKSRFAEEQNATPLSDTTATLEKLVGRLQDVKESVAVQQARCSVLRRDLLRAYHTVFINPGSGPVFCYTLSCAMYQKREVQVLQLSTTADLASFKFHNAPTAPGEALATINERNVSDAVATSIQSAKILNLLHGTHRRSRAKIRSSVQAVDVNSFGEVSEDPTSQPAPNGTAVASPTRPRGQSLAPIAPSSVPTNVTATRSHSTLLSPLLRLLDSETMRGESLLGDVSRTSLLVVPSCVSLWYPLTSPVALLQELILPESVQSIAEFNGVVCVGLQREYSILSLVDGDARSLLPIPPTLRQTQYQKLHNLLTAQIQIRKEEAEGASPSRSVGAPTNSDCIKWLSDDELSYFYHNNVPPHMLASTRGGIQRVEELSELTGPYKDGFVEGGPGMPSLTINERSNEAYLRLGSSVFVVNLRAMPSLSVTSSSSASTTAAIASATLQALLPMLTATISSANNINTSSFSVGSPLLAGSRTSGLDATAAMSSAVFMVNTERNFAASSTRSVPLHPMQPNQSAAVSASVTIEKSVMLPYTRLANAVDTAMLAQFAAQSGGIEAMFDDINGSDRKSSFVSPLLVAGCVSTFPAVTAVLQTLRATPSVASPVLSSISAESFSGFQATVGSSQHFVDDSSAQTAAPSSFLKKTLRFDSEPRTLVSAHPFLFAFCAEGCSVYSVYDDELIEELPIPGVCFVSQSVHSHTILCASRKKLWLLQCASLDDQLEQLVLRPNHVENAFDLLQHRPPSSTVFCQPMIIPSAGVINRVSFTMQLERELCECASSSSPLEAASRTKLLSMMWALAADVVPPLPLKGALTVSDAVRRIFLSLIRHKEPLDTSSMADSEAEEMDSSSRATSFQRFTSLTDLLSQGTVESGAVPDLVADLYIHRNGDSHPHHSSQETSSWASDILSALPGSEMSTHKLVQLQLMIQDPQLGVGYQPNPKTWSGVDASALASSASETKRPIASPAELEANLHVCSGLGYLYKNVPSDATRHLGVYVDVREILLHVPETIPLPRYMSDDEPSIDYDDTSSIPALDALTYHSTDEHENLFWSGYRPKHPHNRLHELYSLYEVLNVVQVAAYTKEEQLHPKDSAPPLPPNLTPSHHEILQVLHAGWCDAYYANGAVIDPATGTTIVGDTTGTAKRQFDITNFPHHMQSLVNHHGCSNGMITLSMPEYLQISMDNLKAELLSWLRSRLPTAGPFQRRAIEYALLVLYIQTRDLRSAYKVVSESEFMKVADCWSLLMNHSLPPQDKALRARLMLLLLKRQLGIRTESDVTGEDRNLLVSFCRRYLSGAKNEDGDDYLNMLLPTPSTGITSEQYTFLQGGSQWSAILHDVIKATHDHFKGVHYKPNVDSTSELFYALDSGDFEYVSEALINLVDDHGSEVLKSTAPFIFFTTDILGNNGFHMVFRQIVLGLRLAQAVENELWDDGNNTVLSPSEDASLVPLAASLATMAALLHHGALCSDPIRRSTGGVDASLVEFEKLIFSALSSPASILLLVSPNGCGVTPLGYVQAMSKAGVEAVELNTAKQLGIDTHAPTPSLSTASLPHPETIVIPAILAHIRMMALPM